MIRRMGKGDLDAVAAIWLDANREAHDFIPAAYWLGHFEEVRTALARAEVWGFETEARAEISGFIGLLGDYIAGIFVRREARSGSPTHRRTFVVRSARPPRGSYRVPCRSAAIALMVKSRRRRSSSRESVNVTVSGLRWSR